PGPRWGGPGPGGRRLGLRPARANHQRRTLVTTPPTTAAPHALSALQLRCWRDDGFLVLRGFFPSIAEAAAEADGLPARHRPLIDARNLPCRFQPDTRPGACTFECFDPIIDLSPACRRLALDARLLGALGALYGDAACLFKDKLIFKPAGVKGY